jgi:hypothetical protein
MYDQYLLPPRLVKWWKVLRGIRCLVK